MKEFALHKSGASRHPPVIINARDLLSGHAHVDARHDARVKGLDARNDIQEFTDGHLRESIDLGAH